MKLSAAELEKAKRVAFIVSGLIYLLLKEGVKRKQSKIDLQFLFS
jgi:hypothetical protein